LQAEKATASIMEVLEAEAVSLGRDGSEAHNARPATGATELPENAEERMMEADGTPPGPRGAVRPATNQ
jgi:hypothetical protein